MDEPTRVCSKCQRALPLSNYYRRKDGGDGYRRDCKDCRSTYDKARYATSGDQIRAQQAIYRADPEHRRIDRERTAQWRAEHPEWAKALTAAYRAENRERLRDYYRAWRIANPERRREYNRRRDARKRRMRGGGTIRRDLLAAKLAYWGHRCWIDGPTCTVEPEQWDHVKPLSKGGSHLLANLRPACAPCNTSKRASWPYPLTYGPRRVVAC